ncbi:GNAT family N-acetyltransferase [Sphingomonas sp. BK580]|uniref:GNAT family N-acetyltransferase n=1 Tax=Sphingomonas sp. BK580 TaxID=2586972 RepID=UPI00161AE3DC|nr:GNAT family N-acetyltransferase [Sphingomonas sp. BK580]MBB3692704.1 RimJ/RimL family protein N-acetyltransferase [Sphingomonas sp. BK580]
MIVTERLILRPAEPRDRAALHAMWADPRVMTELGPVKDEAASDAAIARHAGYRADAGLGFGVVERRDDGAVLGFCGLKPGAPTTPIRGELEIGWMLSRAAWGQGYAREAAAAWLEWAWSRRDEPRVVAITAASNTASRRLMARLGMACLAGGDFDHPDFAANDPRRATVTYAIDRPR